MVRLFGMPVSPLLGDSLGCPPQMRAADRARGSVFQSRDRHDSRLSSGMGTYTLITMSAPTPPAFFRALLATLALGSAGCSSMLGPERSASVIVHPAPGAATSPLLTGPTEIEMAALLARHSYRYSNRHDAAWLAHVEQRPSETNPAANIYVLTRIVRNPKSRHVADTPRDPSGVEGTHPSLSMLERYERAEQTRAGSN